LQDFVDNTYEHKIIILQAEDHEEQVAAAVRLNATSRTIKLATFYFSKLSQLGVGSLLIFALNLHK
jgi:hypothetical protein